MAKNDSKIRYFVSKPQTSGRTLHYWQPSASLRTHGFLPRRLSNDLDTAIREAIELNKELDAWRKPEQQDASQPLRPGSPISKLIEAYKKDPAFTKKAFATQRSYKQCLERIEAWAGDHPISSITRANVKDFHRTLYATKPAFANAIGRMAGILFEFAVDRELIEHNPAHRLKMHKLDPREEVWAEDDLQKFTKKALEMDYPSMALALQLGICTAQRQSDILHLCWTQIDNHEIRLRQRKTGRWVAVPMLPELIEAIASTERKSEYVVTSEKTGTGYKPDYFRHLFKEIMVAAEVEGVQFLDLRRTAVVRLAEAGVSVAGITAITGHDVSHCEAILETYMPRNSEMAREAIRTFKSHRARKAREQRKSESWKK